MASTNLMVRAAREIQAKNKTIQRLRVQKDNPVDTTINYVSGLGGGVAAAFIDSKYGDGEKVPTWIGLPRNAWLAIGGMAYGIAAPKKFPLKGAIGHVGLGMGIAAAYRFTFDKMEEREAEKAAASSAEVDV